MTARGVRHHGNPVPEAFRVEERRCLRCGRRVLLFIPVNGPIRARPLGGGYVCSDCRRTEVESMIAGMRRRGR